MRQRKSALYRSRRVVTSAAAAAAARTSHIGVAAASNIMGALRWHSLLAAAKEHRANHI